MSDSEQFIWSNTDYPYLCLVDKERTEAFRLAINESVKPGNIVVDIGSGTGIFSLFAAAAGASKVYAVEIEHSLAQGLRETVKANNFENIIEVIESDALEAILPKNVDVVIAELIETGLLDEMQVPVINNLWERGIISKNTTLIPQGYVTDFELVHVDDSYYGFNIKAPKHLWPYYAKGDEWLNPDVTPVSNKKSVCSLDFRVGVNNLAVDQTIFFDQQINDLYINALRLSGQIILTPNISLGSTNSVNGDKVINLSSELCNAITKDKNLNISYIMGGGLGSLKLSPQ